MTMPDMTPAKFAVWIMATAAKLAGWVFEGTRTVQQMEGVWVAIQAVIITKTVQVIVDADRMHRKAPLLRRCRITVHARYIDVDRCRQQGCLRAWLKFSFGETFALCGWWTLVVPTSQDTSKKYKLDHRPEQRTALEELAGRAS